MTRALVTMYAGEHDSFRVATEVPMREYADRHGYNLIEADAIAGLPPGSAKAPAIAAALRSHELVLWVDADVLIVDGSDDVDDHVRSSAIQALSADSRLPAGCTTTVWLVRRCAEAREVLAAVGPRQLSHPPAAATLDDIRRDYPDLTVDDLRPGGEFETVGADLQIIDPDQAWPCSSY